MNDSTSSINVDNSLYSKETTISSSSENQSQISISTKNQIIKSIMLNLQELITENEQTERKKYIQYDIFFLEKIPPISIGDYIKRLVTYTKMDISSLILAIIYIDQFCDSYKYVLSSHNIHRILMTACLISIKFNEDYIVSTKKYGEIAGVSAKDLYCLEYQMYFALNCSLLVDESYYSKYFDYFSQYDKSKDE